MSCMVRSWMERLSRLRVCAVTRHWVLRAFDEYVLAACAHDPPTRTNLGNPVVAHLIAPSPFVKRNSNFLDVEIFVIVSGCNARTFSMRSGGNVTLIRSRFFDMLELSLPSRC